MKLGFWKNDLVFVQLFLKDIQAFVGVFPTYLHMYTQNTTSKLGDGIQLHFGMFWEVGVCGIPIMSLYSGSLVHIVSYKSDLFSAGLTLPGLPFITDSDVIL